MEKQNINIAFSINNNHLIYAMITSLSLAMNNQQHSLSIYIVHSGDINNGDLQKYLKIFNFDKNIQKNILRISYFICVKLILLKNIFKK
jgi:lipopolysaccharide biosynthesis glycosyltransferase